MSSECVLRGKGGSHILTRDENQDKGVENINAGGKCGDYESVLLK